MTSQEKLSLPDSVCRASLPVEPVPLSHHSNSLVSTSQTRLQIIFDQKYFLDRWKVINVI